ncbi:alpha/beta hydrolase [Okibacterium fritillariae]|uniref:Acetyl esterase/lipase n=1 Tax=Okibacterium fritillariae TaxID=123320 RepID=A0A1T5IF76_9MICO|nr:alpha/beta hydrolase [Okibacterium fritillariae]SKC37846.1 Acetyl esterase/lipase [Okibacterium fritillariae]
MGEYSIEVTDSVVPGPHGGVPIRHYVDPGHPRPAAHVVWVHGGGFIRGSLELPESDQVARALAAEGIATTAVGYRLVRPSLSRAAHTADSRRARSRNRFPVPLDDVVAVVRQVQEQHPEGVILGGASAGACLSAGAVMRLAADGDAPLLGTFFTYGFFHARLPKGPREDRPRSRGHRRYSHSAALLDMLNRIYVGDPAVLRDPTAFAGGHDLSGFPSSLLLDADRDTMRASGGQFGRELVAAGVETDYSVMPETAHAFLNRPLDPAFRPAIDHIADWVRSRSLVTPK